MRKLSAIALVSCLTLGATAAFAAQTTPSTSMDKPAASGTMTKTTKTTTATTKTTTAKSHKVSGDISKLDCTAKTLTVGTTDLSLTDTTKISMGGKKGACSDLKDGAKATASYTEKDGKNWAKYISAK
jgi:hypothetical protein